MFAVVVVFVFAGAGAVVFAVVVVVAGVVAGGGGVEMNAAIMRTGFNRSRAWSHSSWGLVL